MVDALSEEAFREDLIKLIPRMRAFAFSLTRDAHSADDLVQDALVKALSNANLFQPGTNLRAWLLTIVRNTFYNDVRYGKFRQTSPIDEVAESTFQVNESQHKYMEFQDVLAGLNQLTPEHREVIILIGAEGVSYEEAAEICGCPVGTVKSRLNRARQQLHDFAEGQTPKQKQRLANAAK